MTVSMREKLARAIAVADGKDPDAPAWVHFRGGKMYPEGICWRDQYGKLADAVLDVLAEPDEGMIEAGSSMWVEGDWDHWEDKARIEPDRPADEDGPFRPGLQSVWQAMLQAARSPAKED